MVIAAARILFGAALWLGALAVLAQDDVQVIASVDRTTPRLNESFTFVLTAEGRVRGEPDIAPLTEMFEVLRSQESTRIQIANGRAQQIAEWIYLLMPTQPGKTLIPPIEVGGHYSNPVEIEVLPPSADADAPGEIFLEVEVSPERAYVQSQIVYTLRLFVGTMTGRATITPPQIVEGDAIIERLGDDTEYRATRGGHEFTVRERRYAIFPQRAGPLTIGSATFEAMVIPPRGFSRVQRFSSDPIEVDVLAPVPPPASHPNAVWLPAARLELTEAWGSGHAPEELVVGVPTTRSVRIEAEGVLETQLPELGLPQARGVRLYADRPELSRSVGPAGFAAARVERYAVLPQAAGEAALPRMELPWFNVTTGRWEVASLAPRTLAVLPGEQQAAPLPEPAVQPGADRLALPAPAAPVRNIWPAVSAVLAIGWFVTALLWWHSRSFARRAPSPLAPQPEMRPSEGGALKRVRLACKKNDPAAARTALLEWAEARFPADPPRSLGALAARLPDSTAAAIRELDGALYAPGGREWEGADLVAALTLGRGTRERSRRADPLRPLYR